MNTSTPNILSQVPLVNSTQILTQSAQVPVMSVVNPTPVVAAQPIIAPPVPGSVVPAPQMVGSIVNANSVMGPLVDEDYRLGRGILDDFRPTPYKSQILAGTTMGVGNLGTTNVVLSQTGPVMSVNTPAVTLGPSTIKDFL